MFFVIFFCLGAFFLVSEHNLNLNEKGNFSNLSGMYVVWLDQLFIQFKTYTGYAVNMDWLPKNVTTSA